MKYDFLLDENILLRAVMGPDLRSAKLWVTIFRNCHRAIWSPDYAAKQHQRLREIRSSLCNFPIPGFEKILRTMLTNRAKTCYVIDDPVQEEIYVRHDKDRFLIRIAIIHQRALPAQRKCLFVTTDQETREDFKRAEISQRYEIEALTIEEGLSFASQT